jgi:hypothetical protein
MLLQIFIFSLGYKKGDKNNIDEVIKYIINRFYYNGIDPAELFFFGLKFDENNKVNVGNGTDESHFNICFSTLKLLKRLENIGMFHVDCTYKIIKYFYPLLVFGITDYDRHFHPIAFMVTSHETEEDFKYFFVSLNTIANDLKITFQLKSIVSDACHAMYNALNEVYLNIIIVLCWFHVKLNVRKHKKLIPVNMYSKVMRVLDSMHNCKSMEQLNILIELNVNKWITMKTMRKFGKYFQSQ